MQHLPCAETSLIVFVSSLLLSVGAFFILDPLIDGGPWYDGFGELFFAILILGLGTLIGTILAIVSLSKETEGKRKGVLALLLNGIPFLLILPAVLYALSALVR